MLFSISIVIVVGDNKKRSHRYSLQMADCLVENGIAIARDLQRRHFAPRIDMIDVPVGLTGRYLDRCKRHVEFEQRQMRTGRVGTQHAAWPCII
jgi:hypothetical protein